MLWKYDSDILEEDGLEMKETRNKGPLKDFNNCQVRNNEGQWVGQ